MALTGQFEPAIEFLSRFERYRTHAVHIALALNEHFMLGLPRNVQQALRKFKWDISVSRGEKKYNFKISDPQFLLILMIRCHYVD